MMPLRLSPIPLAREDSTGSGVDMNVEPDAPPSGDSSRVLHLPSNMRTPAGRAAVNESGDSDAYRGPSGSRGLFLAARRGAASQSDSHGSHAYSSFGTPASGASASGVSAGSGSMVSMIIDDGSDASGDVSRQ